MGDAGADFLDDPDLFVAQDAAFRDGVQVTLENVQIGAADGGFADAHHGVGHPVQFGHGGVLPGHFAWTVIDEGFHEVVGVERMPLKHALDATLSAFAQ